MQRAKKKKRTSYKEQVSDDKLVPTNLWVQVKKAFATFNVNFSTCLLYFILGLCLFLALCNLRVMHSFFLKLLFSRT